MKTFIKNPLRLPGLVAVFCSVLVGHVTGQTFTVLYWFTGSEGGNPNGLILSGDTLYGTSAHGGIGDSGTLFDVKTDGTGFTTLHKFTARTISSGVYTNSDGSFPQGLILSGNILYGTAAYGTSSGNGTVFAVKTDGTGFTNLYNFTATSTSFPHTNRDGAFPQGGLVISQNTLYGTAYAGGDSGNGTVFKVNTDGTGFTTLHNFTGAAYSLPPNYYTNLDGGNPLAGLVLSSNILYGTTSSGGSWGNGTVFAVKTDGTGFANLHSFTATPSVPYINSDGANPEAGLILSSNTLYGTAIFGGSSGHGTVFAVKTDGTGFTNLYSFTDVPFPYTNSDGATPRAGLTLSGSTLYGAAASGGISGNGTMFGLNTDGTAFTILHSFTYGNSITNSEGSGPSAALILSGSTLYGTRFYQGYSGSGTVFSLSLGSGTPPQLSISRSGGDVVLSWATNFTGFSLQSTTNLASPVWSSNSTAPIVVNGQNTVTNPISGTQQFFRLVQ